MDNYFGYLFCGSLPIFHLFLGPGGGGGPTTSMSMEINHFWLLQFNVLEVDKSGNWEI